MKDNIFASGISGVDHIAAWDKIMSDRWGALDITPVLVYLIDIAPAAALNSIGDQFNILGLEGWFLANSDDDKRQLIKNAIAIKRFKGTPSAVKNAFKSVGYGDCSIVEGTTAYYDGTFEFGGELTYGSNWWAFFTVEDLDLGEKKGLNDTDVELLKKLIEIYKREVTHLLDISFSANVSDEIIMKGIISFQVLDIDSNVLEEFTGENLIVDAGRTNLAHLLAGDVTDRNINTIGFGLGTTAEDPSDTILTSAFTKSFDSISYPDSKSVQVNWTLDYSESNGVDITEFGLISVNGDLFSRKVRDAISKNDTIKLVGYWIISFE